MAVFSSTGKYKGSFRADSIRVDPQFCVSQLHYTLNVFAHGIKPFCMRMLRYFWNRATRRRSKGSTLREGGCAFGAGLQSEW